MNQYLMVILGSALGGVLRYSTTQFILHWFPNQAISTPTLVVNLIGSFSIGVLYAISIQHDWNILLKLFLIVGLLGGFTTFSSFSLDVFRLMQESIGQVLLYICTSIIGGICLAIVGFWLVKKIGI